MREEKEIVREIIAELHQAKTKSSVRQAREELMAHVMHADCPEARDLAQAALSGKVPPNASGAAPADARTPARG